MKLSRLFGLSISIAVFGIGCQYTSIKASTWHSGTPLFLRGKWRSRAALTPIEKNNATVIFKRNTITFDYFGSMPDKFNDLKWHKVHKYTYSIKAKRFIDGYKVAHYLMIKRLSRNTIYVHLDGHKYPVTSTQKTFHRVR